MRCLYPDKNIESIIFTPSAELLSCCAPAMKSQSGFFFFFSEFPSPLPHSLVVAAPRRGVQSATAGGSPVLLTMACEVTRLSRMSKLTSFWHSRLFSSMSVCRLVKTWLPNERRALKPAECLVPLKRRGPGHTGPLFLLPTERPEYKTQLCRQTRGWSRRNSFSTLR